jgi:hypothetical protein
MPISQRCVDTLKVSGTGLPVKPDGYSTSSVTVLAFSNVQPIFSIPHEAFRITIGVATYYYA